MQLRKVRLSSLSLLVLALILPACSTVSTKGTSSLPERSRSKPSPQESFQSLVLENVYLDYKQFFPGGHYPLITQNGLPNRQLAQELNLHLNMRVFKYGFWENMVHSMTDKPVVGGPAGQFRLIGWQFTVGIRLTRHLDVFYNHFSQHLLDTTYQYGHWPVQDSWGIRLNIYGNSRPGPSIF